MTEASGIRIISESGVKSFIPCIPGKTSDGYHTFDELYEHRCLLFAALMKLRPDRSWRSRLHHDGSQWEGWFIAGMDLPDWLDSSVTYHFPERMWSLLDNVRELDRAPEWDGHTSQDVLERLRNWVGGMRILFVADDLPVVDEMAGIYADDGLSGGDRPCP